MKGTLFVLSAPSGSGKTTLLRRLLRTEKDMMFSVSCTTRPPRPGERNGKDYRFMTKRAFRALARRGGLLEWAEVHGNLYGTPRVPVERALRAGRDVCMDLDPRGARNVRRRMGRDRTALVLVVPPSARELRRRLARRGDTSRAETARRMRDAETFLAAHALYDYIVVNDRLERCVAELRAIRRAERARAAQRAPRVARLRKELTSHSDTKKDPIS